MNAQKFNHKVDHVSLVRCYQTFAKHYQPHRKPLIWASIGLAMTVLLSLLTPWPLKLALDHLLLQEPWPETLSWLEAWAANDPIWVLAVLALSIVIIEVLAAVFSYMNKFHISSVGHAMVADIRARMFEKLQRLSLAFHQRTKTGALTYRLVKEVAELKQMLVSLPQTILFQTLTLIGVFIVMAMVEWRLALMSVMLVPVLFALSLKFKVLIQNRTRQQKKAADRVTANISENTQTLPIIQAYGLEDAEKARFEDVNNIHLKHQLRALNLSKTFDRMVDLILAISTAAVLYFATRWVWAGDLSPGTLVLFTAYLKQAYDAPNKLSKAFLSFGKGQAVTERVVELLENDEVIMDAPTAKPAPRFKGHIAFRDVDFAYEPSVPVLEQINVDIQPGETVALFGQSGAGKSTMMKLLLRFYDPSKGQILIDGVDIREFQLQSLREQITLVLQDPMLFHKSIRDNIAMGNIDATDDEVIQAAQSAQIHDFIVSLPQGYDTLIKEGGVNLSGGQRQRIHIARAMLRNTPILILDEPTTGLDLETETKLQTALKNLMKDKTTWIIAHQSSTVALADRVFVLENGRLSEKDDDRFDQAASVSPTDQSIPKTSSSIGQS